MLFIFWIHKNWCSDLENILFIVVVDFYIIKWEEVFIVFTDELGNLFGQPAGSFNNVRNVLPKLLPAFWDSAVHSWRKIYFIVYYWWAIFASVSEACKRRRRFLVWRFYGWGKIDENKKITMDITLIYSCHLIIVPIHRLENPNHLTYGNVESASKLWDSISYKNVDIRCVLVAY